MVTPSWSSCVLILVLHVWLLLVFVIFLGFFKSCILFGFFLRSNSNRTINVIRVKIVLKWNMYHIFVLYILDALPIFKYWIGASVRSKTWVGFKYTFFLLYFLSSDRCFAWVTSCPHLYFNRFAGSGLVPNFHCLLEYFQHF